MEFPAHTVVAPAAFECGDDGQYPIVEVVEDEGLVAETQSMSSGSKIVILKIVGKNGEPSQEVEIEEGGIVPCMIWGRYYENMPSGSCYCWTHKRALENLERKWRPLPVSTRGGWLQTH